MIDMERQKQKADDFSFEIRMGEAIFNDYVTTGKRLSLQDAVAAASKR
jgi:hypothetical protein